MMRLHTRGGERTRLRCTALIHSERAVLGDAERRIVLAHDIGGEVDGIHDPRDEKDPPTGPQARQTTRPIATSRAESS